MTLPDERTRAVLQTREFLLALLHENKKLPPSLLREKAGRLLRHYPTSFEMGEAARQAPDIFGAAKDENPR